MGFGIILHVAARAEANAAIAQSVEHVIGNDEVIGPNPISSSKAKGSPNRVGPFGLVLLFGARSDMEARRAE